MGAHNEVEGERMFVNKWECAHVYERDVEGHAKAGDRCTMTASGVGPALGLIAVGWHVEGGKILCPAHRPDPAPCRDERWDGSPNTNWGKPCSACKAESEAKRYQAALADLDALDARKRERMVSDDERRELAALRRGAPGKLDLIDTLTVERDEARTQARDMEFTADEMRRDIEEARRLLGGWTTALASTGS